MISMPAKQPSGSGQLTSPSATPRCVAVSPHAYRRGRERFHWAAPTVLRMAERALCAGIRPSELKHSLKILLEGKGSIGNSRAPLLYGEIVYVFAEDLVNGRVTLVTLFRAETGLLRALAAQRSSANRRLN